MYARFEQSNFIEKRSQTRSQFLERKNSLYAPQHTHIEVEWFFFIIRNIQVFLPGGAQKKKTEALLIDFFSASTFLCVQGKSLYEHYVNTIHI